MKKRSLWIITALMIIALIGVCVMQAYYIRQAYSLKTQIFDQNVNKALLNVTNKVQKLNTVVHIANKNKEITNQNESSIRSQTDKIVAFKEKFRATENQRRFLQQQTLFNFLDFQISKIKEGYITPLIISEAEYQAFYNTDKDIFAGLDLTVLNIPNSKGEIVSRQLIPRSARRIQPPLGANGRPPDTIRFVAISPEDLLPRFISLSGSDKDLDSKFEIENASALRKYDLELERLYADTLVLSKEGRNFIEDVQKEMQYSNIPLSKRISKLTLDTLIRNELLNLGITSKFDYWLSLARKDSVIFKNANNPLRFDDQSDYHKVTLFSNDVIRDPGMLYVYFPNQIRAVFKDMAITLGSSLGFLLLLIFIFTYTIYSIIRQKKISEMKTDFINNMTHEFKTPVATIMLASEALKEPDVVEDVQRVNRLAGIIYDENVRLGNHIERVLNIARLDKKDIELENSAVDLNRIIENVVESMALQLNSKEASVMLELNAEYSVLNADELHLSNVIYNLIDNANKYSNGKPEITIRTQNIADKIILEIEDKGIGMTKEQSKRIFDQFYRVPTGNLHDVKGFGLGLNYVKDIIEEMKASILVKSEKDVGTLFEITFEQ